MGGEHASHIPERIFERGTTARGVVAELGAGLEPLSYVVT